MDFTRRCYLAGVSYRPGQFPTSSCYTMDTDLSSSLTASLMFSAPLLARSAYGLARLLLFLCRPTPSCWTVAKISESLGTLAATGGGLLMFLLYELVLFC